MISQNNTNNDSVIIIDNPHRDEIQFLDEKIYEYNVSTTGITDGNYLASFVRNEQNEIIAGIFGWTWGQCCEIKYLWVHESLRKKGLGSKLLAAADKEARRRGAKQMVLDTHSFQAPEFYQRFGFEIVGVIENYPLGHQKICMRKYLV